MWTIDAMHFKSKSSVIYERYLPSNWVCSLFNSIHSCYFSSNIVSYLLGARPYSGNLTYLSFKIFISPVKYYYNPNWSSERLNNLPKVTQLISSRVQIRNLDLYVSRVYTLTIICGSVWNFQLSCVLCNFFSSIMFKQCQWKLCWKYQSKKIWERQCETLWRGFFCLWELLGWLSICVQLFKKHEALKM